MAPTKQRFFLRFCRPCSETWFDCARGVLIKFVSACGCDSSDSAIQKFTGWLIHFQTSGWWFGTFFIFPYIGNKSSQSSLVSPFRGSPMASTNQPGSGAGRNRTSLAVIWSSGAFLLFSFWSLDRVGRCGGSSFAFFVLHYALQISYNWFGQFLTHPLFVFFFVLLLLTSLLWFKV